MSATRASRWEGVPVRRALRAFSPGHLGEVLEALGADDHLLGWFGLEYLLEEAKSLHRNMPELDGVHLVLDTERLGSTEITDRIRSARADKLSRGRAEVG